MNRVARTFAAVTIGMIVGAVISIPSVYAAGNKVDCDAVMKEVTAGKKAKEIAKDMSISVSSVYRCKKKEMAAAKAASKAGNETSAKPAASPAAAPKH